MKILVLGGTGMIGHRMWATLSSCGHDVYALCRTDISSKLSRIPGIDISKGYFGIDVADINKTQNIITQVKPELVINCIGIVKQLPISRDPVVSIQFNALLPHQISEICKKNNARMIHFSSDCVFSGKNGMYDESALPDELDMYGRSKALGEITDQKHVLTMRTSTIGREIKPHGGLFEWFLSNKGKTIKGYSGAIYSGFPTHTLAKYIDKYILPQNISGLFHVASEPINKFELLNQIKKMLNFDIEITEDKSVNLDRSLDSSRFRSEFNAPLLSWHEMLEDILIDYEIYESMRD